MKDKIIRKLNRARERLKYYVDKYKDDDKTSKYTFHAGWHLGYEQARVSMLEDILDELEDAK